MKIPRTILSSSRSLQFFQLMRFGALFLSSIVFARIIGDRNIIGQYEKLVLIGSSFSFFWVSGIINAFIPYYKASEEREKPRLIFNVFLLLSLLSVLVFLVLNVLKPVLFSGSHLYFEYYLLFTLFSAPAFLVEYLLLLTDSPRTLFYYAILVGALHFTSIALPLFLGYSLGTSLFCLMLSGIFRYLLMLGIILNLKEKRPDIKVMVSFLKKASPLILSLLLGGSMSYVDSYMAAYFSDSSGFAIFQYGARELPLVLLMANALSNVLSGDIAEANKNTSLPESLKSLKKSSLRLMNLLFPITLVMILFSSFLFTKVYGPGFAPSSHIFNVYLLLIISRLVFPQTVLLGMQENKMLLYISFFETVLNIGLNLLLLYFFGLIGIAIATVVAFYVEKMLQVLILYKKQLKPADYIPLRPWLAYSLLTLLVFGLMEGLFQ